MPGQEPSRTKFKATSSMSQVPSFKCLMKYYRIIIDIAKLMYIFKKKFQVRSAEKEQKRSEFSCSPAKSDKRRKL